MKTQLTDDLLAALIKIKRLGGVSAEAAIASAAITRAKEAHNAPDPLREALKPFAAVADAYDANKLDDVRPEWGNQGDADYTILHGRGGKELLTLRHFLNAREALR